MEDKIAALSELSPPSLSSLKEPLKEPLKDYLLKSGSEESLSIALASYPVKGTPEEIKNIYSAWLGDLSSRFSLRIGNSPEGEERIIEEAYTAFRYTNHLRGICHSFKYIYLYSNEGKYIIEEDLPYPSLSEYLSRDISREKIISILSLLFLALSYAHLKGVYGLEKEIVVKEVGQSVVPVFLSSGLFFIKTFGAIPVFVSLKASPTPRSLKSEQEEILNLVSSLTPKEFLPLPSLDLFLSSTAEIISPDFSLPFPFPLSPGLLAKTKIGRLIAAAPPPYSRISNFVRSIIMRMDEILSSMPSLRGAMRSLASSILISYSEILLPLHKNWSQAFKGERIYREAFSKSRYADYEARVVKSDLAFVKECSSIPIPPSEDINKILNEAIKKVSDFAPLLPPSPSSLHELLISLRSASSLVLLYRITDSVLKAFSKSPKFRWKREAAEHMEEIYEEKLSVMTKESLPKKILKREEAVTVLLYEIFKGEKIPSALLISYENFIKNISKKSIARESFISLDPLVFF